MTPKQAPRQGVWMNQFAEAWRTENADKTSNGVRTLVRAARPELIPHIFGKSPDFSVYAAVGGVGELAFLYTQQGVLR